MLKIYQFAILATLLSSTMLSNVTDETTIRQDIRHCVTIWTELWFPLSPPYLETEEIRIYKQKLSYFWMAQSGVGIAGTVLNSFVLWIFWKERQSLNTSINTMTRWSFWKISIHSILFEWITLYLLAWTLCFVFCTRWWSSGGPTWWSVGLRVAGAASHSWTEKWSESQTNVLFI